MIGLLLLCILPILVVLFELSRRKHYATLPPGPKPLPLLGNMIEFLDATCPKHEKLAQLSEKYGDIMTVWFLTKPVVILSSVDVVRKAYIEKQHDFASRPDTVLSTLFFDDYDQDVIFGRYSPRWANKRKLMHASVRLVAGTQRLEKETIASVEQIIAKMLREQSKCQIDMRHYTIQAVYNMVMILVFGKRFDLDDPEFLRFCEFHNVDAVAITAARVYDMIPVSAKIAESISPTLRKMKGLIRFYQSYLSRWFNETDDTSDEIEHMTQAFKKSLTAFETKAAMKGDDGAIISQQFNGKEILDMMMNLYMASTSTTSSAISWLFLEMVRHPDIQERCHNELMQVVGSDRKVSLGDRPNLPYIEACILETLRFHSPVSLNVPHTPSADARIGDYLIPAGTDTIMNIWAIHHNPALWKDAHNFNPDNFLDDQGRLTRPPQMMPFGAGRRVCLGEAFAKNSIFLMFTVMLQNLHLERIDGYEYSLERADASGEFINVPKPFFISVRQRYNSN